MPRDHRTAEQEAAVFSYWRTTVPGVDRRQRRIETSGRQYPEGSSQLVLRERDRSRATRTF